MIVIILFKNIEMHININKPKISKIENHLVLK